MCQARHANDGYLRSLLFPSALKLVASPAAATPFLSHCVSSRIAKCVCTGIKRCGSGCHRLTPPDLFHFSPPHFVPSRISTRVFAGINSYGIGKHRHMPEIEQGLSEAAGKPVQISFTPHLINMSRGMQTTSYVKMADGVTVDQLRHALVEKYASEPFVKVLDKGLVPATRHVRGSNFCLINVFPDRLKGRAVVISVIDNLVKGASGQALQNMNLMMGFPETTALMQLAMFP
eukprot:185469-Chlamydomonas_euryale.AAC.5